MDILVVDDEAEIRLMLSEMLKSKGHKVIIAENGKKAIDYLMIYKVDLIITDIVMPEIEGIEFILRLRQSKIPIISMSGLSRETVVSEFMASLGIVGFLQKPFDTGELLQVVDNIQEGLKEKLIADC